MKQAAAAYGNAQRPGIERSSSGTNKDDRARLVAEAMATYRQKRVVLDELDEASWTLLTKVATSCDRILIAGGANVEAEWEQGPAV